MADLNYHHLRLFWAIAHEGSLTKAAHRLHLSQSALSVQLRKLEDQMGHPLFERRGRGLHLTEAGRMALDCADTIFETGDELLGALAGRPAHRQVLRVGALTTLSRNLQMEFLRPLIARSDVGLVVRSGSLRELSTLLHAQAIDVAITNMALPRDAKTGMHSHILDEQRVSLVGRPIKGRRFRFPDDLRGTPVILPSHDSEIRVAFDRVLALAEIRPTIVAEVDDMAMLRLLARESAAVTLVPPIVVRDELSRGELVELARVPDVNERFYGIVADRRFPHPLLKELLRPLPLVLRPKRLRPKR